MSKNFAFTLAEVLITLGIIGIIAAMTIPTVITNYKKQEVQTKLSKIYSVMNEAIRQSELENGNIIEWDWTLSHFAPYQKQLEWYNKYLSKYIKINKIENIISKNNANVLTIYFADGSILYTNWGDMNDFSFFINKKAMKNGKVGKDIFFFRLKPKSNSIYHKNKYFEPFAETWDGNINHLYQNAPNNYGCADQYGNFCTKIIQLNGWKIPKDYPIKF